MKPSPEWPTKLFGVGLTIAVLSTISLTFIKSHYLFVFLPKYYGSFSNIFRQKSEISFKPGLAYLQTTTGMVLVSLALSGILLGFGMMKISTLIHEKRLRQWEQEAMEQWMKENNIEQPPKQSTTKKRNPKRHRKLKKHKPNN